jgi:hypothetical protein
MCLLLAAGLAGSAAAGDTGKARRACNDRGPLDGVCDYLTDRKGIVQVALYDQQAVVPTGSRKATTPSTPPAS